MAITLYYAPDACSLVPYVTLTEADANFEVRPLNLKKGEQRSVEYARLNPKHKVPVLVVNELVLSENVAIQIWIARNFPRSRLLPDDPWKELNAISLMAWFASGIHPYLTRIFAPSRVCDIAGAAERVRKLAEGPLLENYRLVDGMLAGREYFFEHFTAADAYFFWCFRRGMDFGLDLSGFANCGLHFRRMSDRESVRKMSAYEASVKHRFSEAP